MFKAMVIERLEKIEDRFGKIESDLKIMRNNNEYNNKINIIDKNMQIITESGKKSFEIRKERAMIKPGYGFPYEHNCIKIIPIEKNKDLAQFIEISCDELDKYLYLLYKKIGKELQFVYSFHEIPSL